LLSDDTVIHDIDAIGLVKDVECVSDEDTGAIREGATEEAVFQDRLADK
jgi:hypothetical protein